MMKIVLLLLTFVGLNLSANAQFKVVAYLPNYSGTFDQYVDAFDFTKITHLNIAFFNPDVNGNFPTNQGAGLAVLVNKAHLNNVKVLISLAGGADQPQYANLLMPANRSAFIDKVVALLSQYNVDGIDVDLEEGNMDQNYEGFVTELSSRLKPLNKLLTGAVAWGTRTKVTDACLSAYDFINIMAYGGGAGNHAAIEYARQHIDYWKNNRGMPSNKLVLGIGFYARYDTPNQTPNNVAIRYNQLLTQYPGAENKDYLVHEDGYIINYHNAMNTKNRTALALAECGGMMIWQILQDATGNNSLLKAIDDKIKENVGWKSPYLTWKYNLEDASGNGTTLYGAASAYKSAISQRSRFPATTPSTIGFLAYPYQGTGRVGLPGNSGASFELTDNHSKLEMLASSTNSPSKFSWYNITEATSLVSVSFNLQLNAAATVDGVMIIPVGKSTSTDNVFNNNNQLTSIATTGIFAAFRLNFNAGNFATLLYRNAAFGYAQINNNLFNKTGTYKIAVYCNNNTTDQQYVKGSNTYTIPAQTVNLWVNDLMVKGSSDLTNFPATGELAINEAIDGIAINMSNNVLTPANSLKALISDIKVDYAYTTTSNLVLPIKLNYFVAKKQNNKVQLTWETASEKGNSAYEIWRSSYSGDQLITVIKGSGTTNSAIKYTYTDAHPKNGTNYYQLKQIDNDGHYTTTAPVAVNIKLEDTKLKAFVDAQKQLVVAYLNGDKETATIKITDMNGKILVRKTIESTPGYHQEFINVATFPTGIYVLSLIDSKKNNYVKIKID